MQVDLISRSRHRTPAPNGRDCATSSAVNVRFSCVMLRGAQDVSKSAGRSTAHPIEGGSREDMYVPSSFDVEDGKTLESFISRYGFATLITSSSAGLIASHIPITLRKRGDANCLIGHMARANNQWRGVDGTAGALAIFFGPHAHVSPTWHATSPPGPTREYPVVT